MCWHGRLLCSCAWLYIVLLVTSVQHNHMRLLLLLLLAAAGQVKEYVPPAPEAVNAPPSELPLAQLRAEGQAKQAALEAWARTAYGEVGGGWGVQGWLACWALTAAAGGGVQLHGCMDGSRG